MIRLKSLIRESDEYPIDSDQWEDWYEYIKYFEYEIEKPELKKLIKRFNLKYNVKLNNQFVTVWDTSQTVYFRYNKDNETFDLIKDVQDWFFDLSDSDIEEMVGHSADDSYNDHIEGTLKEMKFNPGKVYHYTTEEKWKAIQEDGVLNQSYGTGITNRSTKGIFTSTSPETYHDGSYGNVCLEIDLSAFKKEMNISEMDLEYEPDVADYLLRSDLVSALEMYDSIHIDLSSDMSPSTIIVGYSIPIKYIKKLG